MSNPSTHFSTASLPVHRIMSAGSDKTNDLVVVEEPLEIRLAYGPAGDRTEKPISITMRTPGQDRELATGFLFTEGIISDASEITSIDQGYRIDHTNTPRSEDPNPGTHSQDIGGASSTPSLPSPSNTIVIRLKDSFIPDLGRLERHFYTSSSCGVCGKSSIEAVRTVVLRQQGDNGTNMQNDQTIARERVQIAPSLLYSLPALLRQQQNIFESTGGLHASALFDLQGNLVAIREDVGRHNALDKLIGLALQKALLPLRSCILLLSGRASFELIQKAAMAGIPLVAAIGPPSSLAVSLAEEYGMTLIGFLREERFNVYTGVQRVLTSSGI